MIPLDMYLCVAAHMHNAYTFRTLQTVLGQQRIHEHICLLLSNVRFECLLFITHKAALWR